MRQSSRRPGRDTATGAAEAVTIGQALRAAALSPAGDRPVDHADAAAVQAAEQRATGLRGGAVVPGGVAALARRAAEMNTKAPEEEARGGGEEEGKPVTLRDVLMGEDASAVVPGDRAVTWVDAEKVAAASGRGARGGSGLGVVADALAAAAHMNEGP